MLLSMVGSGENVQIVKISGKDDTRRHLAGMGFIEGEKIRVVSEMSGGLILEVKGTRIAIDRSMASRIVCEQTSPCSTSSDFDAGACGSPS